MILHKQHQYPPIRAKQRRAQYGCLWFAKEPHVEWMKRIATKHKVCLAMKAEPVSKPSAGSHQSRVMPFRNLTNTMLSQFKHFYGYSVSKSRLQRWLAISLIEYNKEQICAVHGIGSGYIEAASQVRKYYKCMGLITRIERNWFEGYDKHILIKAVHGVAYGAKQWWMTGTNPPGSQTDSVTSLCMEPKHWVRINTNRH
jgi:hypothetical protein